MSTIAHTWMRSKPPAVDVYLTRRNQSKYLTKRYWDGQAWFEIGFGSRRGGIPFTWPKKSRTGMTKWEREANKDGTLFLRRIGVHQGVIEWGAPYKVFSDAEVLAYLVKTGRLATDWRNYYQDEMRWRTL